MAVVVGLISTVSIAYPILLNEPVRGTRIPVYSPFDVALNPKTDTLYITSLSHTLVVVNAHTDSVIANISLGSGSPPWDVAINPETNMVYVGGNALIVIDGSTNREVARLKAGVNDIAVDSSTNLVFVAAENDNHGGGYVVVVDGKTNAVVANLTAKLTGWRSADAISVNPKTGLVYVLDSVFDSVSVVQESTDKVIAKININTLVLPTTLAVNPATNLVYVAAYETIAVINGTTNAVVNNIPTGEWLTATAINPVTNIVYASNYESGSVTVIDGATNTVKSTVKVGYGPKGIAVDSTNDLIYVAIAGSNAVLKTNG